MAISTSVEAHGTCRGRTSTPASQDSLPSGSRTIHQCPAGPSCRTCPRIRPGRAVAYRDRHRWFGRTDHQGDGSRRSPEGPAAAIPFGRSGNLVRQHPSRCRPVEQDVAGPAVLGGGGGVPVTVRLGGQLVEQDCEMAPGQLANSLLADCGARPGRRHLTHVFQVAARESPHLGEGGSQIDHKPVDDFGAPALSFLSIQNGTA